MTVFRPCIDLHQGRVKQIVGGSLTDQGAKTNFISPRPAAYFAELYRSHQLTGGHVIALGAGNEDAAIAALNAWPGGLQFGGGVTLDNATHYLDQGASHVIVTSHLFENNAFSWPRLQELSKLVGADKLVLDLSCRKTAGGWNIATQRWQVTTETAITPKLLEQLSQYCSEFLIHAADVEGLQQGIDQELVVFLGKHSPLPVTYAGGARHLEDLKRVKSLSQGKVDLTIGSALDIFGGKGVKLSEVIAFNKAAG